jgi:hypothetical protein
MATCMSILFHIAESEKLTASGPGHSDGLILVASALVKQWGQSSLCKNSLPVTGL